MAHSLNASAYGFNPIPQSDTNYYSYTSPPHSQQNNSTHEYEHAASSFHGQVEIDLEDELTPLPPTANDGQLEGTSTRAETQKMERLSSKTFSASCLQQAALSGDWTVAKRFLPKIGRVSDPITQDHDNVLHIAARCKHTAFVEKLMNIMTAEDMALTNKHGNTALWLAATSGAVKIAKLIMEKNDGKDSLPYLHGSKNTTPLFIEISYKHTHMTAYLLSVTDVNKLNPLEQLQILIATIHKQIFRY